MPKYYPLTQSQKMMFYNMSFSLHKEIVNICAIIEIEEPVEEKLLMQATVLTMMRIPACNMRVCKMENKAVMQYESDAVPDGVELVDLSGKSPEEIERLMNEWDSKPFPDGGMNTRLYVVRLLRMPEGRHALHFCVSHVVFDAYSLMDCVQQIDKSYAALKNNTPLPPAPKSPFPAYEADYAYEAGPHHAADIEYWKEQFKTEPHFTTLDGGDSPEFLRGGRTGKTLHLLRNRAVQRNLRIPKELVARIDAYSAAARVSPQCLYLLTLRTYLGLTCGTDDVTMMMSIARRATLNQKRAGGTMVNSVPLRTTFAHSETFADGCRLLSLGQGEAFRHGNISCEEVLSLIKKLWNGKIGKGYISVCTTYQPYFAVGDSTLRFHFRRLPNGYSSTPMYMSIMPMDNSGDFWVNYEYECAAVRDEAVERYHAFLLAFLDRALAAPDKTLAALAQGLCSEKETAQSITRQ